MNIQLGVIYADMVDFTDLILSHFISTFFSASFSFSFSSFSFFSLNSSSPFLLAISMETLILPRDDATVATASLRSMI